MPLVKRRSAARQAIIVDDLSVRFIGAMVRGVHSVQCVCLFSMVILFVVEQRKYSRLKLLSFGLCATNPMVYRAGLATVSKYLFSDLSEGCSFLVHLDGSPTDTDGFIGVALTQVLKLAVGPLETEAKECGGDAPTPHDDDIVRVVYELARP